MSSYFVNSFSGRYPNGPDYQLLNYGASSGAMNGGTYRDSTSATMHHATGSYGYGYNGMDLTVSNSRGGGGGSTGGGSSSGGGTGAHFGGASVGFGSPERGFRQASSSCSLASDSSLLSPGAGGGDTKGSPSKQESSGSLSSPNLPSSGAGGGKTQHYTELDDGSPDAEDMQHGHVGNPSSRTTQKQDAGPVGSAPVTGSDGHAPQIFPWMRKLHISHGTRHSVVFLISWELVVVPFVS